MGNVYDTERVSNNPRCSDVKEAVIIINYFGIFFSSIFLLIGIIRMILIKTRFSFITNIIMFIFFSELLNVISKVLQFLKYIFEDKRYPPHTNEEPTDRGIICQFQIIFAITSDFCSLLGTLLLSYRCQEVIKSKRRFFDRKCSRILSFILIISISAITSIILLIIDRNITWEKVGFSFDVRDRCSYWCWLEHYSSMGCYCLYIIILVLNIVFACKTNSQLKTAFNKLKDKSVIYIENENTPNDNNQNSDETSRKKRYNSPEDKEKIIELKLMRVKCLIYPILTILIWILASIYRFTDDIIMLDIDYKSEGGDSTEAEINFFKKYPFLRIIEEVTIVLHTLLSSFRGVVYGFCFIIFEENSIGNLFRKKCGKCCFCICCCCIDNEYIDDLEDNENKLNISNNSLLSNSSEKEINPVEENVKTSEGEFGGNNEMNNSNYHYNE